MQIGPQTPEKNSHFVVRTARSILNVLVLTASVFNLAFATILFGLWLNSYLAIEQFGSTSRQGIGEHDFGYLFLGLGLGVIPAAYGIWSAFRRKTAAHKVLALLLNLAVAPVLHVIVGMFGGSGLGPVI